MSAIAATKRHSNSCQLNNARFNGPDPDGHKPDSALKHSDERNSHLQDTIAQVPALSVFSPAKLNLFLHITGKRADGYHQLQTVFRLLDWGDRLQFWCAEPLTCARQQPVLATQLLKLLGADAITKDPSDNLILKAVDALLQYLDTDTKAKRSCAVADLTQVVVKIDKVIPMGAGLGGGSSNAAATLMALNRLWQLKLSQQQLIQIAASVGADVPIFILGSDAIGEGIGEQLTAITLPKQRYLLLFPKEHISSAQLFAHPKLRRNCPILSHSQIINAASDYSCALRPPFHNVFEPIVCQLSPAVRQALEYLYQLAADLATVYHLEPTQLTPRLTGSGSTVFLPLPTTVSQQTTDLEQLLHSWLAGAPCATQIVSSHLP